MKKLIILPIFLLSGCVTQKIEDVVNSIPQHQFGEFEYSRTGNYSSGSIKASNGRFEDGYHILDSVSAQHTNRVTGVVGFSFTGLKRPIKTGVTSATGN
tara:strand:+ start:898 stop:1194 length:297 start_codon:yes stop_codon:yes gene_type:complete